MGIRAGLGAGRLAEAGLLAAALLLATRELDRAPLEYHEAYVVETAREMGERGDWIVPWFNGEPRLTKPPLSYWLTVLAARAAGSGGEVRPWHGRLPSALAGVGLVALVLWLGRRLYDRSTALLAGIMMVSSFAFFHYTHNARADLLYAFWCGLALAAFVQVWRAMEAGRPSRWAPFVVWGALAAATLTKGPQVPAMFVAAIAVWARVDREPARRVVRALRPAWGPALYLLLAAPWWLALRSRLVDGALEGSQLSGSLLRPGWPAADYLYRLPQLLTPWALLLPVLAAVEWRGTDGRAARWLGIVAGVPIVIFSMGSQQRVFYTLPVVMPIFLLLAAGARRVLDRPAGRDRLGRWVAWVGPGFALLIALLAAALLAGWSRIPDPPPGGQGRLLLLLAATLALGAGVAWARRRRISAGAMGVYGLALIAFAGLWLLGPPVQEWSKGRRMADRLGRTAARHAEGAGVWTYGFSPDPYVYYAGPPVREILSADSLVALLERRGELVLIATEPGLADLPVGVEVRPILRAGERGGEPTLVARVGRSGLPPGP